MMTEQLFRAERRLRVAAIPLGVAVIVATIFAGRAMLDVRIDYTLRSFVSGNNHHIESYRRLSEAFSGNELVLLAVHQASPWTTADVADLAALADKCRHVDGVQMAVSLADLPVPTTVGYARYATGSHTILDEIREDAPQRSAAQVLAELAGHHLYRGNFISNDARTLCVLINLGSPGEHGHRRANMVRQLQRIVDVQQQYNPQRQYHLAGGPIMFMELFRYLHTDLVRFVVLSIGIIVISLVVLFRKWQWVLLPVVVASVSVVWTLALTVWFDVAVSLITQMMITLVAVISVGTCVHLINAYDQQKRTAPIERRVMNVLRLLFWPCTIVVATTASGFWSLTVCDLAPVRQFGMFMGIAVVISLAAAVLCMPAVVFLVDRSCAPSNDHTHASLAGRRSQSPRRRLIDMILVGSWWLTTRRTFVLGGCVLVAVLCLAGLPRLHLQTDFTRNFRADSDIRAAYRFIEPHLGPLGLFEVFVQPYDGLSATDPEVIRRCHQFQRLIQDQMDYDVRTLALPDLLVDDAGHLSDNDWSLRMKIAALRTIKGGAILSPMVSSDTTMLRITVRAPESLPADDKLRIISHVRRLALDSFGDIADIEVNGPYLIYADLTTGLAADQVTSFSLAAVLISIVLLVAYRSVIMTALTVVANALALILCLGFMAYANIELNIGSVMMLSVAFGIAVDNAIHYLWRYRMYHRRGISQSMAVWGALRSVGRACVATTIVVTLGFWVLCFSQFMPTVYFGLLVGVALAGSIVANLVVLPAALRGPVRE